jgi:hypothetical protein
VREAPEFLDDLPMVRRVAQLSVTQRLRMKRLIEERSHHRVGCLTIAARKCVFCDGAGHRISRKGARFAAKHVGRKLIERQHQRERAFCAVLPVRKIAARRSLMHGQKPRPNAEVKRTIVREPGFRPSFAPEKSRFQQAS